MLGLGIAAYCVAVFQRGSLGVAGPLAQERFGATAAALSLVVVLQLAVYAALQVPVGVLLDRLGSRRMVAVGALVMGAGQILLAESHSVGPAAVARVLVGTGDAMTFTSVLRLIPAWFPPPRIPVLTQVTSLLGQLGQVAAAVPLVALLHSAGWTPSFLGAGLAGLAVGAVIITCLRDAPPAVPSETIGDPRAHLRAAWREPGTQLGFWTHFVTQFSALAFVLLWGYPFLIQGEGRTPQEAAALLTMTVVGAAAIGPVVGQLASRWPSRRSSLTLTIVMGTATAWTVALAWPGRAPLAVLAMLGVVLATNLPGSLLGFDYARTENKPAQLGAATGIVNAGGFTASLAAILLIGLLLDVRRPGGAGGYALGDFRVAFAAQYAIWAVGVAGVLTARRRLRALRAPELDPFPRAVARITRAHVGERAQTVSDPAASSVEVPRPKPQRS